MPALSAKSLFLMLLPVVLSLSGCSKTTSPLAPSAEPTLVAVEVIGKTQYLVGEEFQLQSVASYSDGAKTDVTTRSQWTNAQAATVDVNPTTGLLKALTEGESGVVASFQGISGTLNVVVQRGENDPNSPVIAVRVQGASEVATGASVQWRAIAEREDGQQRDVTDMSAWSSNAVMTATVSGGIVTGVAVGNATISVRYEGHEASGAVRVSTGVVADIESLSIAGNPSLFVGQGTQLQAVAHLADGNTSPVTGLAEWTSSNPDSASVVAGLISAHSVGPALITATYNGFSAELLIEVRPAITNDPITITGPVCAAPGQSGQLTASANGRDITDDVAWASSNSAVASVDGDGLLSCIAPGTATVTAVLAPYASTSIDVVVTGAPPADPSSRGRR